MGKLGVKFKAVASDYEEDMTLKMTPKKLAQFLSRGKAEAVAKKYKKHLIVGADSFVVLDNEILGKPHTSEKATEMLRKISGKVVSNMTGFTIIDTLNKKSVSKTVEAKIFIKKISEEEIVNYVKSGEPLDRAGAFAVQGLGALLVKKIEGDFLGIMGLPLFDLAVELKKFGIKII
jgi:septum formation protein